MSWNILDQMEPQYRALAANIVKSDKLFGLFKKINLWQVITGLPDENYSCYCYNALTEHPDLFKKFEEYKQNDRLGSPPLSRWKIAHDTIRFANTICLINDHLGSQDGKVVYEYGSNYGGLYYLFQMTWKPKVYYLKDLPELEALSERYLKELGVIPIFAPSVVNDIDLFLSEYSLTEYDMKTVQDTLTQLNPKVIFLRENFFIFDLYKEFERWMKNRYDVIVNEEEKPSHRRLNHIIIAKKL